MADQIDQAQELNEERTQAALSSRQQYQGESAAFCCECGEEIPEGRRQAVPGVQHCVECAE